MTTKSADGTNPIKTSEEIERLNSQVAYLQMKDGRKLSYYQYGAN